MRRRKLVLMLIILGGLVGFFSLREARDFDSESEDGRSLTLDGRSSVTESNRSAQALNPTDTEDSRVTRMGDGTVYYHPSLDMSRELVQSADPQDNLSVIEEILNHYRYAYAENPVGSENFEITQQLLGKNPKNIVFVDPKMERLVDERLVDQWGSPYFFHALSATNMEIRSAGPDHLMWTEDDLVSGNPRD